jgi:hypothetical protein
MLDQIRKIGWLAAEAGVLAIVLCVLLHILLGNDGGSYIASVSENTTQFLGSLSPGVAVGVALIVALFWFVKGRVHS